LTPIKVQKAQGKKRESNKKGRKKRNREKNRRSTTAGKEEHNFWEQVLQKEFEEENHKKNVPLSQSGRGGTNRKSDFQAKKIRQRISHRVYQFGEMVVPSKPFLNEKKQKKRGKKSTSQ